MTKTAISTLPATSWAGSCRFPAKPETAVFRQFPAFLRNQAALAYTSDKSDQDPRVGTLGPPWIRGPRVRIQGSQQGPGGPDPGSQGLLRGPGRASRDPPGPSRLAEPGQPGPGCYPTLHPDRQEAIWMTGPDRPKMRERSERCCPRGQHRGGAEQGPEPRALFSDAGADR